MRTSDRRVILITVESFRPDRSATYGAAPSAMPRFDQFAAGAVVFENAFTPTPLTFPAVAGLLTGRPPSVVGVVDDEGSVLSTRHSRLPARLLAGGWATGAFVNAPFLDEDSGVFEGFLRVVNPALSEGAGRDQTAEDLFSAALEFLETHRPLPTFVWVHLFDTHFPYRGPGVSGSGTTRYTAALAAADRALGDFLSRLREAGLEQDALIVIASDHGEGLGAASEMTHGIFLTDATLRVPLVVRTPHHPEARRVAAPVTLLDVSPTLADYAGLAPVTDPGPLDGRTLRPLLETPSGAAGGFTADRPILTETCVPSFEFLWPALRQVRSGSAPTAAAMSAAPGTLPPLPVGVRSPDAESRSEALSISARAVADLDASRFAAAEVEARALLAREPGAPAAAALAATALRAQGKGADAEAILRSAVSSVPSADGWARLARFRQEMGGSPAAEWERAAAADPSRPRFRIREAEALLDVGQRKEAVAAARAAVAVDPESATLNAALGRVYLRAGELENALRMYATAVEKSPGSSLYHRRLAGVALSMGNPDGALKMLEEAKRIDPLDRSIHRDLGDVHAAKGDLPRARTEYAAAAPGLREPQLSLNFAENLIRAGHVGPAADVVKEILAKHSDNAEAHYIQGQVDLARKDLDAAEREFREALRIEGDRATIYYGLARIALLRDDESTALAYLDRVFTANDPVVRRALQTDPLLASPARTPELRRAVQAYLAGVFRPKGTGS